MSVKNGVHKGGIVNFMASDHKILVLTPAQYLEEMTSWKHIAQILNYERLAIP